MKETRGGYRPRAGRPTNEEKGLNRKVQKSFSLHLSTYERLKKEAARRDLSASELVEQIINELIVD